LADVFGGLDGFKAAFKKAAVSQFGSGWTWLVMADGKLEIIATPNVVNPIVHRQVPLLTCDVWEHAYYLVYQNRRGDFVAAVLDYIVN
jgi:Fe-Mn family superoxide dismutase